MHRARISSVFLTHCAALLLAIQPWHFAHAGQDLNAAVQSFLYQQVQEMGDEVTIELTTPTARFPECASPRPFLPSNLRQRLLGRISVGVRCGPQGESVRYLTAHIAVMGDFLEVATAVPAGTPLRQDMLAVRRGDLSRLPPQAVLDPGLALGQMARRRLMPGTVLQDWHLAPLPVVERGQKVDVESRGAHFVVSRKGEAMEAGGLGEAIRVRLSSREVMTAVVQGDGRVSIEF